MSKKFVEEYHKILNPEFPEFLKKYLNIPIISRLKGIGLLCGTDWTDFFSNNFFYSRFDHSIGVALIIWHFTHDKAQTISGLLHDVSTPAFSHVSDFRKGDSLTQTSTEEENSLMLENSPELIKCLSEDGLALSQVDDYHKYPIADNEVPRLSADRLEYMFPSGAALKGTWSLKESFDIEQIKLIYDDLVLCRNENGIEELGFKTKEIAELYTHRTTDIGLFLQKNEDKMAMQFPASILNMAINLSVLSERDFYTLSEKEIIDKLDLLVKENPHAKISEDLIEISTGKNKDKKYSDEKKFLNLNSPDTIEKLVVFYRTYRSFKSITRSKKPLKGHYCVNLKVKQRYINPLLVTGLKIDGLYEAKRITDVSKKIRQEIEYFLSYDENCYGCVKLN